MKVTWSWLGEFLELDLSLEEIAERLTMGGIEVEGMTRIGTGLSDVVCAEIEAVTPHPQADRLRVCTVRTGQGESRQVVCGAPDVTVGQKVAFAPAGSTLPGGKSITATEIRGVASSGMLCSGAELDLNDDAGGLLLLPPESGVGLAVGELLGATDTVIEVSITPNRGDCLSVLGLAREISALTGQRLRVPSLSVVESGEPIDELIDIRIADADLCARYVGRVISGVRVGPSPLRLQNRLRAVGLRPINNVVDVTNYVMIERGQPLHAFDYDRLPAGEITVRRAREGEILRTLDGEYRRLTVDDLLITSGDVPVAIAGVMGGENTEVSGTTTRVLLESAWFAPASVRQTSKRLGLRSEASFRFERVTDVAGVPAAADRAAQLIVALAGGSVAAGRREAYPRPQRPAAIELRPQRVEDLLGTRIDSDAIAKRLRDFGMDIRGGAAGAPLVVVPPSYRSDLTREIDLIEEMARSLGYENLPATTPNCALTGAGEPPKRARQRSLAGLLLGLGMDESVMLSFCSPQENALFPGLQKASAAVEVINPITQESSELRRSLCSGLLNVARHNLTQGNGSLATFSIGKVFWPYGDAYEEGLRLGGLIYRSLPSLGFGSRGAQAEFEDIKGIVESVLEQFRLSPEWRSAEAVSSFHPGQTAQLSFDGRPLGIVGRLHPRLAEEQGIEAPCWIFELDLEFLLNYEPPPISFKELSRFPAVVRDLAIVAAEEFESLEVIRFILGFAGGKGLVEHVELFDSYRGDPIPAGKRSLAYSISYRAIDRTLTDTEVNELHQELIRALGQSLPVEMR